MEDFARQNEKYCGLEHQELWGLCHWQERLFLDGGVWLHDWRKFESLDHLDKYESQYGLFYPSYQEASKNGAERYGQHNRFFSEEKIKKRRSVQVHL
jgi:hypothetical protein